jgi:uncharacterized protein YbaR (Trm112 family)
MSRLLEIFICPFCKRLSWDGYRAIPLGENYHCRTQCRRCGKLVHSVDCFDRCPSCDDNLSCLAEGSAAQILVNSYPQLSEGFLTKEVADKLVAEIQPQIEKSLKEKKQ